MLSGGAVSDEGHLVMIGVDHGRHMEPVVKMPCNRKRDLDSNQIHKRRGLDKEVHPERRVEQIDSNETSTWTTETERAA